MAWRPLGKGRGGRLRPEKAARSGGCAQTRSDPVLLPRRCSGLPVHPRGDVHVHDQAAAVLLAGHNAGEAPLRHPLPGGSAQRLSGSRGRQR